MSSNYEAPHFAKGKGVGGEAYIYIKQIATTTKYVH
jgi:hypothetical protein